MNSDDENMFNMPERIKPSSPIHHLTSVFPYFYLSMTVMLGMIIALAGYDTHIKATLVKPLAMSNSTEAFVWELMNSCVPLGGFIGTFLVSFLSSMASEKVILLSIQLVGLAGSALYFCAYFSSSNTCFTLSRFLHGGAMSFGIVTMFNLVPRGRHPIVSSTIQPLINFGILLSGVASLDYITRKIWVVTIFPLVVTQFIQAIIVIILPESPISIFKRTRDTEKTVKSLVMIRNPKWNYNKELEQITEDALNDEILGYAIMSIGFIAADVSNRYQYNKVGLGAICVVLIGFNTGPGSLPWIHLNRNINKLLKES
ncbi:hypothetical protein MXB_124 [Myxobolus squamalis]|nr:hypothetical protein MXB_124 [Myxobolus squamalis]